MSLKWGSWAERGRQKQTAAEDMDKKHKLSEEVYEAKAEWERASHAFQEARGVDEIDFAIYTLEAAERRYQIHLKEAKRQGYLWGMLVDPNMKDYQEPGF